MVTTTRIVVFPVMVLLMPVVTGLVWYIVKCNNDSLDDFLASA